MSLQSATSSQLSLFLFRNPHVPFCGECLSGYSATVEYFFVVGLNIHTFLIDSIIKSANNRKMSTVFGSICTQDCKDNWPLVSCVFVSLQKNPLIFCQLLVLAFPLSMLGLVAYFCYQRPDRTRNKFAHHFIDVAETVCCNRCHDQESFVLTSRLT